jgi:hypothetical protein
MVRFTMNKDGETKGFTTSGGEEVTLKIRRLTRLEKVDVACHQARLDLASAERLLLRCAVKGWEGVCNQDGQPVPFSFDALDQVLGLDNALGKAVSDWLFLSEGLSLAEAIETSPLDRPSAPASASTSTAEQ